MSAKRRKFSPEFKTKAVLELLESGKTINEIASKYNIIPKSLIMWKKEFLDNASVVFEESVPSKKYKEELKEKDEKIELLQKTLGRTIVERDWLSKKVKSSGLTDLSLVTPGLAIISLTRQCELLGINRTSVYYEKTIKQPDKAVLDRIDEIFTDHPYYGYRRISAALDLDGHEVNPKKALKYMKILGIQALYPRKKRFTTIPDSMHRKYPYLLKNMAVTRPNQVWASDISYIRLKNGFAYLCAVIDLYTRSILSWRLSPVMDERLTLSVLNDALSSCGRPEIFNSDQGSQYTAQGFINTLAAHGISISMDSCGRAYDNIIMERFWRTVKHENVYPSGYLNINDARAGINEYMHKYNNARLHSALNYKPPMSVYNEYFRKAA